MTFIHLNTHSEYSLHDGLMTPETLIQESAAAKMMAVALTDHSNFFGAVKFTRAALAHKVKPILGAEIYLENPHCPKSPYSSLLLCQNEIGYHHLIQLLADAYQTRVTDPIVTYQNLEKYHAGLIALSGGVKGDIASALLNRDLETAKKRLYAWQKLFGDRFYLEISRVGDPRETKIEQDIILLAQNNDIPLVATNAVRFVKESDFEAHEARICVQTSELLDHPHRIKHYFSSQYFKSEKEMCALFADLPDALTNSVEIMKRCNFIMTLNTISMPNFPLPENVDPKKYLIEKAETGLKACFTHQPLSAEKEKIYDERLKSELSVICSMGFAGYFLIVADFIQWAKDHDIPVGPGRGSGAGSLVAFALKITGVDPIVYDLLFERFLNPERVSLPDFDIDFCIEGRDRVIEYVAQKYGQSCVAQIVTFGTMAARAVIRDVGRVLGMPLGFIDKIAKMIPFEVGITLERAFEESSLKNLYENDAEVKTLVDLAKSLEGIARNVGKNASGVVISPGPLVNFIPVFCEEGSDQWLSQFDKDDLEVVGLVKFDFLGLRNLTVIRQAVIKINQKRAKNGEIPIDIDVIPLDDPKPFQLLQACRTAAIFQLESRGMRDLVRKLQPSEFEDLIALVALYRPGPLQSGMVDDFINRRHGRASIEYSHALLEPILKPTYGVILYQEQVTRIAQVMAGYTLGGADLLRRAMGKKKPEEMAKQRLKFVEGATKYHKIPEKLSGEIFDLMEKFAGYGFNKAHSAAYGLITYQTAYLKAHYPAEFMAAVLSSEMQQTEKLAQFFEECKRMNLHILPPDINVSVAEFKTQGEKNILYGLSAIKGLGDTAADAILTTRASGLFVSLHDFCSRVDARKITKKVLEVLIKSGAFDLISENRAALFETIPTMIQVAGKQQESQSGDLFENFEKQEVSYNTKKEWPLFQRLNYEKEVLGFYLTGHPMSLYRAEFEKLDAIAIGKIDPRLHKNIRVAGLIDDIRIVFTKRNEKIGFVTLEDETGKIDLGLFRETLQNYQSLLEKDQMLVADGELTPDPLLERHRLNIRHIFTLPDLRAAKKVILKIVLKREKITEKTLSDLFNALSQFKLDAEDENRKKINVILVYEQIDFTTESILSFKIKPDDTLMIALKSQEICSEVDWIYPK